MCLVFHPTWYFPLRTRRVWEMGGGGLLNGQSPLSVTKFILNFIIPCEILFWVISVPASGNWFMVKLDMPVFSHSQSRFEQIKPTRALNYRHVILIDLSYTCRNISQKRVMNILKYVNNMKHINFKPYI